MRKLLIALAAVVALATPIALDATPVQAGRTGCSSWNTGNQGWAHHCAGGTDAYQARAQCRRWTNHALSTVYGPWKQPGSWTTQTSVAQCPYGTSLMYGWTVYVV